MVLLDEVVEILRLAYFNLYTGLTLEAFNSGRVGAAFVDADLLWYLIPDSVRIGHNCHAVQPSGVSSFDLWTQI